MGIFLVVQGELGAELCSMFLLCFHRRGRVFLCGCCIWLLCELFLAIYAQGLLVSWVAVRIRLGKCITCLRWGFTTFTVFYRRIGTKQDNLRGSTSRVVRVPHPVFDFSSLLPKGWIQPSYLWASAHREANSRSFRYRGWRREGWVIADVSILWFILKGEDWACCVMGWVLWSFWGSLNLCRWRRGRCRWGWGRFRLWGYRWLFLWGGGILVVISFLTTFHIIRPLSNNIWTSLMRKWLLL